MKILIVGLGSIARKHIKALSSMNVKAEIHALRNSKNASEVSGVKNIFSEREIEANYDFAIISNPTGLHYHSINLLIHKKIPLFIEKPPLATLKGSEELNDRLIASRIKTYVACNLRFHPCIKFLRRIIAERGTKVNEVNVYCGSFLPDWRPEINFKENYSANKEQGGGVHLDLFHELDYVHWIFGTPLKVKSHKTNKSFLNIDAIDYANYILCYQNFSVSVILNYYRRTPKREIEVLFDNSTISIDLIKNQIFEEGTLIYSDPTFKIFDTYLFQMEFFLSDVLSGGTQLNTFAESLEVLKTCLHDE